MENPPPFKPSWWLPGGHLQTIWAALRKRKIDIPLVRERLLLPDGDFVDLDWISGDESAPLVLILHGLEGSIESSYAKGMMSALKNAGLRAVFMHFRGCSGEENKSTKSYHAGETGDIDFVLRTLKCRGPSSHIAVIGFSLGGNALLKYLGETGMDNPISCAVAVSVPFLLDRCLLKRGSFIYQKHLLSKLRKKMRKRALPVNVDKISTLWEFDDLITAKIHRFEGAEDYYAQSSSYHYLPRIKKNVLILHAYDDPFLYPDAIPRQNELPDNVQLEVHSSGGHMGFISGALPWRPRYWLEERIPPFIKALTPKGINFINHSKP